MGVLSWAVGNIDTLLGAVSDIDGIVAGASADDQLKFGVGIDICCGDLGGANDQNLWLVLCECLSQGLSIETRIILDVQARLHKLLHALLAELICDKYSKTLC